MYSSNQKLTLDLLISIFATFILTTTILAVSTTSWNIDVHFNRTGLFQQCQPTCCCLTRELHRTVTKLALFSVSLLIISTLSSFLLMGTTTQTRSQAYLLVPLTLFCAGISMTLTFLQTYERISVNGYSAFIFLIDNVLAYVLGGLTILHGALFYF